MRNVLSKRRAEREMSQGDLAEAVGVTRQTINAIERCDPSLEFAFGLAGFFDCAIENLFDPSEPVSTRRTVAGLTRSDGATYSASG